MSTPRGGFKETIIIEIIKKKKYLKTIDKQYYYWKNYLHIKYLTNTLFPLLLKLLFATWAASPCLRFRPSVFIRLLSLYWAFVVIFRLSKHFSSVHSVVIVCAGNIRLLFKLLLKFRNVLKYTESRGSLACNQNMKEDTYCY